MRCPFCGFAESKVIDSRPSNEAEAIRRRRECLKCFKRFTTYESAQWLPLMVIKKDETREPFEKSKLLKGLLKACEKRSVSLTELEAISNKIECLLHSDFENEVRSQTIGSLVMDFLKKLDKVAYVRFASVYRDFKDIDSFMEEIKELIKEKE